jgi:hypothetical protein
MADLVGCSAASIYGDEVKLEVDVLADFKRGSFSLDLAVLQQATDTTTTLLRSEIDLADLTKILLGSGGLIAVVKWLKNRKVDRVEKKDDSAEIFTVEGDHNTINVHVPPLLEDRRVRRYLGGVVRPLRRRGVDSFRAERRKGETVEVSEEEAEYFRPPDIEGDLITDQESDQVVKIRTLPLEQLAAKWQFSQGEVHFWAKITDQDFLERAARREITFGGGDALSVRLRTIAHGEPNDPDYDREIVRVHRVMPADKPVQGDIFDSDR